MHAAISAGFWFGTVAFVVVDVVVDVATAAGVDDELQAGTMTKSDMQTSKPNHGERRTDMSSCGFACSPTRIIFAPESGSPDDPRPGVRRARPR